MNKALKVVLSSTALLLLGLGVQSTNNSTRADDPTKADNAGCLGDCGNRRAAAAGWCGNCADHCKGGTESECTASCGDPWNERPCLDKADENVKTCYRNCNGNKPCEGNCGGQYKRDQIDACHNDKAREDRKRSDCLAACGGLTDCRNKWCREDGETRKACYSQVEEATKACEASCGSHEECSEEKCLGVVRYATCNGKFRATGFCVGFSWPL